MPGAKCAETEEYEKPNLSKTNNGKKTHGKNSLPQRKKFLDNAKTILVMGSRRNSKTNRRPPAKRYNRAGSGIKAYYETTYNFGFSRSDAFGGNDKNKSLETIKSAFLLIRDKRNTKFYY